MGFAKYLEDDYEIFLERVEGQSDYGITVNTPVTITITPTVKLVKSEAPVSSAKIKQKCKDCGAPFTLSVREQRFYKNHNLCNPKRCKQCREKRKLRAS